MVWKCKQYGQNSQVTKRQTHTNIYEGCSKSIGFGAMKIKLQHISIHHIIPFEVVSILKPHTVSAVFSFRFPRQLQILSLSNEFFCAGKEEKGAISAYIYIECRTCWMYRAMVTNGTSLVWRDGYTLHIFLESTAMKKTEVKENVII